MICFSSCCLLVHLKWEVIVNLLKGAKQIVSVHTVVVSFFTHCNFQLRFKTRYDLGLTNAADQGTDLYSLKHRGTDFLDQYLSFLSDIFFVFRHYYEALYSKNLVWSLTISESLHTTLCEAKAERILFVVVKWLRLANGLFVSFSIFMFICTGQKPQKFEKCGGVWNKTHGFGYLNKF